MKARPYGEMMRQSIVQFFKENPNEKFSTSDIGIYFNIGFLSANGFLKQIREKNPYKNLKSERGYRRARFYWWDEK